MQSLLLSLALLFFSSCATQYKISEQSRRNTLLTENYGILNDDDIGLYAWVWDGSPSGLLRGHEYWMCHPVKALKANCRDFGPDLFDKVNYSELEVYITEGDKIHEVGARRAVEHGYCLKTINQWKEMMKGEEYFCIGVGYSHNGGKKDGKKLVSWTYDKFKTKKGCTSYFINGCSPGEFKGQGYPHHPYGSVKP